MKVLTHAGGFKREDKSEKIDYTLIPLDVLEKIAVHFTTGALAHGRDNWKKSTDTKTFKQSIFRHMIALQVDSEDEPHAEALIWNVMCLMWHKQNDKEKNKIQKQKK